MAHAEVSCSEIDRKHCAGFDMRAVFLAAGMLASALGAAGQAPATGSLEGQLTDLHSKPLEGARVVVRNARTGAEAETTTTKRGAYRLEGLPVGEYTLDAAVRGGGSGHARGIVVTAGHAARVQTAIALDGRPEVAVEAARVRFYADPVVASQPALAANTRIYVNSGMVQPATRAGVAASEPAAVADEDGPRSPAGAKAQTFSVASLYGLKPVPFTVPGTSAATSSGLKPVPTAEPDLAEGAKNERLADSGAKSPGSPPNSVVAEVKAQAEPAERPFVVHLPVSMPNYQPVLRDSGLSAESVMALARIDLPERPAGLAYALRPAAMPNEQPVLREDGLVAEQVSEWARLNLPGLPTGEANTLRVAEIPAGPDRAGLGVGVGPNPTEAVLDALLATAGVSAAMAALEVAVPMGIEASQMETTRAGSGDVVPRRVEAKAAELDAGSTAGPGVESAAIATTLTSEQLQALPLAGRDWKNFALDEPANAGAAEESSDGTAGQEHASGGATGGGVTVDGAGMKLAFGGRGVGQMSAGRIGAASLMGPGANEAAVATVMERGAAGGQGEAAGERAQVETRGGGSKLHGQIFLFDQQNLWGAQNPFTQWVKETAPGTGTTVPAFEPFAYTPPDRRMTLGAGVGGPVKHTRLTWFAALDADLRNDPGVSTVKHPDDFFAQPTNDEMQVLSARLGLPGANPVAEGVAAYSRVMESLAGLLGPAARTSRQEMAFARVDGRVGERHSFTLEGTGAMLDAPGGGLTRVSESYGNHSFGATRASETWVLGRWEAFLTENLLMVTQGSMGRQVMDLPAEAPSAYEQTLNASAWGQLPQMVVDSRYGFTIGNPAKFGAGNYPNEHVYEARQDVSWVHGTMLLKGGMDFRHNADATSMLRNQTGTYHYSRLENFASDALVFQQFGLADALDPMNQHNCDQRGKAWRDTDGQLHGLGYLPCYSYYSQTLGPTEWHLQTDDWAGYGMAQWQPAKRLVVEAALRWEREILPPPIALLNNPALPMTERLPSLGNQWAPRVSVAWGGGESRWPTLRVGYGMYYGRTDNQVAETALTQSGSLKGDLNFMMRPTDNLNGGGAPPFPYVLTGQPAMAEKPGAVEFGPEFRNGEVHQGVAEMEERLPGRVVVSGSAMVSLGRRLPVTEDTNYDPTVNPGTVTYAVVDGTGKGPIQSPTITVPFYASWPGANAGGRLNADYQQISEITARANSTYEAGVVRISKTAKQGLSFHARYTYAHAMDWNPSEGGQVSGASVLDPTDFRAEYGTSNMDVRHAASLMTIWEAPWKLKGVAGWAANGWMVSGTGQFHSGLPYTMRTSGSIPELQTTSGTAIVGLGPSMNGYGGDNRVIGVGRNTYRYPQTWKADMRVGRRFRMGHERELEVMVESFNLFNHQNVTEIETTGYYIEPSESAGLLPTLNFMTGLKTGQTEFGLPLNVNATDFYRERQVDFGVRWRFLVSPDFYY